MKWLAILLLIFVTNLYVSGDTVFWPLAWVLPIILVWGFRHYPRWYFFWLFVLVLGVSNVFIMQGMTPLPRPVETVFHLLTTLISLLPFWLDRLYNRRVRGVVGSLLLPTSMVLLEYANTMASPWGSWGSIAYTQADNLVIAQFASVLGIYGITFLIYWTAALLNYWLEQGSLRKVRISLLAYLVVMVLVIGYGLVQLQASGKTQQVKVAAIVQSNFEVMRSIYQDYSGEALVIERTVSQADPVMAKLGPAMQDFFGHPMDAKYLATRKLLNHIEEQAFKQGARAVEQGAQIVSWFEGQFYTFTDQENALIERGREFAREHQVSLLMPMAVIAPDKLGKEAFFMKNQIVVIGSSGELVYTYHKAKPVPGAEPVKPGDGVIPVLTLAGARISPVICYDADFPDFMKQVGINNTQILFIPSGDWFDIKQTHHNMARFRAIENGVNVIRPANNGITSFIDSNGRIVEQIDYFEEPNHTLLTEVSLSSRATWFQNISQVFIGLLAVSFLMLVFYYVFSIFRRTQ